MSRDGVKASNLVKAAGRYGLDAHGFRVELEGLKAIPLPAILYWQFNHFVVYEGKSSRGYHLSDPAAATGSSTRRRSARTSPASPSR